MNYDEYERAMAGTLGGRLEELRRQVDAFRAVLLRHPVIWKAVQRARRKSERLRQRHANRLVIFACVCVFTAGIIAGIIQRAHG
jgi:hypothetical protein